MATEVPPGDSRLLSRGIRWLFVNRKTGGVTVAQWPNLALLVFVATSIARRLDRAGGPLQSVLRTVGTVALIAWAVDEIVRGVNPFRRLLGAGVLAVTIAALVG